MKNDIASDIKFNQRLEKDKYFDMETPYGYGGPLTNGNLSKEEQEDFINELKSFCKENSIVSIFFRFHPVLKNYEELKNVIDFRYMHDTIYIDTKNEEVINNNLDSKNRNMIRKAIKNNVTVINKPIFEYKEFISIYNQTMKSLEANDYYYFDDKYFEALKEMKDNCYISYAYINEKPIAASIILFNNKYMHYHLSGTIKEFRNIPATNLILFESAKLAVEKGIEKFHLGGGITQDDSLFGFKKQFNKNDRLQFYIGRCIFDKEAYNYLLQIRKQIDSNFDDKNRNMIQYRY